MSHNINKQKRTSEAISSSFNSGRLPLRDISPSKECFSSVHHCSAEKEGSDRNDGGHGFSGQGHNFSCPICNSF